MTQTHTLWHTKGTLANQTVVYMGAPLPLDARGSAVAALVQDIENAVNMNASLLPNHTLRILVR